MSGEKVEEKVEGILRVEGLSLREDGEKFVGDDFSVVAVEFCGLLRVHRGVEGVSPTLNFGKHRGVS